MFNESNLQSSQFNRAIRENINDEVLQYFPKRKTTHTLLRIYHESFIAYAYCELLVF